MSQPQQITKEKIDELLSSNKIPTVEVEVLSPVSNIKPSKPVSIAISGVSAILSSIYILQYAEPRFIITTPEVINADEKNQFYLAKYTITKFQEKFNVSNENVIVLGPTPELFEKAKILLKHGGIFVSGLPTEVMVMLAQISGFGRLWHYSPVKRKFLVF